MPTAAELLIRMARDGEPPVISEFGLYTLARRLIQDQGYMGTPVPPRNRTLTASRARKLISKATWDAQYGHPPAGGPLPRDPDFGSAIYTTHAADAEKVLLAADLFSCLSHASAIALHGLASPSPAIHITTPDRATWQAQARLEMEKVIGFPPDEAEDEELPYRMIRPIPHAEVRGTPVHRHELRGRIEAIEIADLRVTPIGATFRDALDKPNWCGGMGAVIDLWRQHGARYREAIIDAIDTSSEKILRVRAGYMLDEVLGIQDPRIDGWTADAQRGSSRKLNAAAPYVGHFSARWMLSINVPDPTLPSTSNGS